MIPGANDEETGDGEQEGSRYALVDAREDIKDDVVRQLGIHVSEVFESPGDHAQRLDLTRVHAISC